ncbi:MAG: DUF4405 domain-containing protein [Candidatus Micrarchaeota archaeon]|nr:DUF4405 domain-containing protein [Candidatus Micrarchaeota archaeon]
MESVYSLYLAPSRRIVREIGWRFPFLDKSIIENIHTVSGFLMTAIVALHLSLNYKLFLAEVKSIFKKKE